MKILNRKKINKSQVEQDSTCEVTAPKELHIEILNIEETDDKIILRLNNPEQSIFIKKVDIKNFRKIIKL